MDCSLPGSLVHGILQARILEWVAISSSRGSSWPRIEPSSPALAGRFFISEPRVKPLNLSFVFFFACFCFACVFFCIVFKLHIRDIIQYHTSLFSTLGCPKPSAMLWHGGAGTEHYQVDNGIIHLQENHECCFPVDSHDHWAWSAVYEQDSWGAGQGQRMD